MANSSAVRCMLVQSCGRKDAFHSNHFGSGCDPRTLSTTIFKGRGNRSVSGRERKLRKAIPERCGQQLRHSPNTRIKIESLLLRPDKLPPKTPRLVPATRNTVSSFYVSYFPSKTLLQLPW